VPPSFNFCWTFLLGCRFQFGNLKCKIYKEIKYTVMGLARSVHGFIKKHCHFVMKS
jgi:hypothetical protein